MSIRNQINALLRQKASFVDAMNATALLTVGKGKEGEAGYVAPRLLTEAEKADFDKAEGQVKEIGETIARLEAAERAVAGNAAPAPAPGATPGVAVVPFKPFKGQGFVRYVSAIVRTKGNFGMAAEHAMRWKDQTPEVAELLRAMAVTGEMPADVLRAAVAAGTTTNATWAGPLVYAQNLASEFIELLRPASIIGRLSLRPVPFNVSIPRQTSTAVAGWVGEGGSIPVGKLDFDRLPIPWAKMAIISVITQDLIRNSSPQAEELVRDDLVQSISKGMDLSFIDPAIAAVANVRPASVTNGVAPIPSSGMTLAEIEADLNAALKALAAVDMPMTSPAWVMTPAARITLGSIRGSMDQIAFPEVAQMRLKGYPIIESNNVPTVVATDVQTILVLADWSQVLHAADNAIDVTMSEEATLQMDDAPATPPAAPYASMFQQNMTAIKAEQFQYWVKRRANCLQYISGFVVG